MNSVSKGLAVNLLERLSPTTGAGPDRERRLFDAYGLTTNPFPPAGQPAGHPHLPVAADEEVFRRVQSFFNDQLSQVVVVEGEQGVGKTNLLAHYDRQLREVVADGRLGSYIVRYYSDPEPSFEGVLSRLFQELGEDYVRRLVDTLAATSVEQRTALFASIRNQDMNTALNKLLVAHAADHDTYMDVISQFFEWATGHRLLNRHRDALRVHYRIDTLESKTQVLRDLVEAGRRLGVLKGIFLLLDELEKQDYTTSKTNVLRFLLAIRALIDALPQHLCLMVALTPTAKTRYFQMVPAVQSRMQNSVSLKPYKMWEEARPLVGFYVRKARERARQNMPDVTPGTDEVLSEGEARVVFDEKLELARRVGLEGVTPRDFLDGLHSKADRKIANRLGGAG